MTRFTSRVEWTRISWRVRLWILRRVARACGLLDRMEQENTSGRPVVVILAVSEDARNDALADFADLYHAECERASAAKYFLRRRQKPHVALWQGGGSVVPMWAERPRRRRQ